ncbi:MAG: sigma-70 family RNA polymerase sigma factor [Desulfobacterales bacterium]|nr:sigma-70 family RNA polymerase sigma factor [Desulfobacterales bacterium]
MAACANKIAALVEKAKANDKDSQEQLVDIFYQDIFRMVYYRINSRMDAEDLTQEIFMQMFKSLPGLKEPARFRSWLFMIALNRVRDFYRKKSVMAFFDKTKQPEDADLPDTEDSDNPVSYVMRKEFWKQFHAFTDTLPRGEREVFTLRFVDHLGIREIAETLKKNDSTVKTHLYRALKKFRQTPELHSLLEGETL